MQVFYRRDVEVTRLVPAIVGTELRMRSAVPVLFSVTVCDAISVPTVSCRRPRSSGWAWPQVSGWTVQPGHGGTHRSSSRC